MLSFVDICGEEAARLDYDTAGMYVEGFVRSETGGWVMPKQFTQVANKIRNMEVRKDDVWIVTYPKCGTTWTQEMVWLLTNNLDYQTAKSESLMQRSPFLEVSSLSSLFTEIVAGDKVALDQSVQQVDSMTSPRCIKTHLPQHLLPLQLWTVKPKIIYVARDVKDVIVSYYHHQRLMVGYRSDLDTFCSSFINNEMMYSPFWKHVLDFWRLRTQENVLFYTYEGMQQDLAGIVRKTANFLGKSVSEDDVGELCAHLSFKQMRNNPSVNFQEFSSQLKQKKICADPDGQFMREGKSGSWSNHISQEMAHKIDSWTQEQLRGHDYDPNVLIVDKN